MSRSISVRRNGILLRRRPGVPRGRAVAFREGLLRENQMSYWITFADGTKGSLDRPVEMKTMSEEEAVVFASTLTGKVAVKAQSLPYPARPRLNAVDYSGGKYGPCPPFCYTPERCAGRGSCPKDYACSE